MFSLYSDANACHEKQKKNELHSVLTLVMFIEKDALLGAKIQNRSISTKNIYIYIFVLEMVLNLLRCTIC